jgi:hypothetical protein
MKGSRQRVRKIVQFGVILSSKQFGIIDNIRVG